MKKPLLLSAALSIAVVAVPALAEPQHAEDVIVAVDAADQNRLGIVTATLEAKEVQTSVGALIRVVDPTPLATLDAELASATAASAASESELARTADLAAQDQSASKQALEAARATAAADAATLTTLSRRLDLEWGAALSALAPEQRVALLAAVTSGSAALLRADAPQRPDGVEGRVLVQTAPDAPSIEAEPLGLTGAADPRMQTIGLYCVIRGESARGFRPGRVFAGRIEVPQTTVSGVVLPRAALVRVDGTVWAYLREGKETFARREVVNPRILEEGWFVTRGFAPGATVVVGGAESLVAIERGGEAVEED